jgi:hypothetical protein
MTGMRAELRQLQEEILGNGRVEGHEIERLRQRLYANGRIDRPAVEFLLEVRQRIQRFTPAFEEFCFQAIKDNVLADGRVDATETTWLRRLLIRDGQIDNRERKFLKQLRGEAGQVSPEFQALYEECLR